MTDSTNNSLEEQWQHAFDDTELTPPESVWEKIELGLIPENTLPSKPNVGNKLYYFFGGIVVGLLGVYLWFNNTEKEIQVIEKEQIITQKQLVKIEPINLDKAVEVIIEKTNKRSNYEAEVIEVGVETNHKEEEQKENNEEIPIRTLTDSVEMIEPLTIKNIHSEMGNPTINLPTDQTPYYVKPPVKPQKKSIFKNVKISAGVGVYQ